jgi:hypothetical protein
MSCGTKCRQLDAVVSQAGDRSRMATNPEPDKSIRGVDSQSSVVGADAHRPEPTDFLEVK